MFCKNCGAEITPNMKFCTSCGSKIEPEPVQANPIPDPAPSMPQPATQPQTTYSQPVPNNQQASNTGQAYEPVNNLPMHENDIYPMSSTDRTLRLINFIACIVSIAVSFWAVIPLAWMIPMTVHSWGIYKGKKKNTVAFGVCTLIFTSLVGGILLLCSHKDA